MKKRILATGILLSLCAVLFCGCGKAAIKTDIDSADVNTQNSLSAEAFCEQYEGIWTADNGEFVDIGFIQDADVGTAYFGWGIWNSDAYYGPGIIEGVAVVSSGTYDLTVYFPAQPETGMHSAAEETTMIIRIRDTAAPDNTISVSFDGSRYTDYILDTEDEWGAVSDSGWYWDFLCNWEDDCHWTNPDTQDYVWFSQNGAMPVVVFGNWQSDNNRGFGEIHLISVWPGDNLEMTIYFPEVAADNEAGLLLEEYVYAHVAVDIEQDAIYVFADDWVLGQTYYRAQG